MARNILTFFAMQLLILNNLQCTNPNQSKIENETSEDSTNPFCISYNEEIVIAYDNEDFNQGMSACDEFFLEDCSTENFGAIEEICSKTYYEGISAYTGNQEDISIDETLVPKFYDRLFYFTKFNEFHLFYFDTFVDFLKQAVENQTDYTGNFCQSIKNQSQELQFTEEKSATLKIESAPELKEQIREAVWNAYMQYSLCELHEVKYYLANTQDCALALSRYQEIPDSYQYMAFPLDFDSYQLQIQDCFVNQVNTAINEEEYMTAFYHLAVIDEAFYEDNNDFVSLTISDVKSSLADNFVVLSEKYQCQELNEIKDEYHEKFTLNNGEYSEVKTTIVNDEMLSFLDDEINDCYLHQIQNQHENDLCLDANNSISKIWKYLEEDELNILETANIQCFTNQIIPNADIGNCDEALKLYEQGLTAGVYSADSATKQQEELFNSLGTCQIDLVQSMIQKNDLNLMDFLSKIISDFEDEGGPFVDNPQRIDQQVNEVTHYFAQRYRFRTEEIVRIYEEWLEAFPDSTLAKQGEDLLNRQNKNIPILIIQPTQLVEGLRFQFYNELETQIAIKKPNSPDVEWIYEEYQDSNPFLTDLILEEVFVEYTENSEEKVYTEVEYTYLLLSQQTYSPGIYPLLFKYTLFTNQGYGDQEQDTQTLEFYIWIIGN